MRRRRVEIDKNGNYGPSISRNLKQFKVAELMAVAADSLCVIPTQDKHNGDYRATKWTLKQFEPLRISRILKRLDLTPETVLRSCKRILEDERTKPRIRLETIRIIAEYQIAMASINVVTRKQRLDLTETLPADNPNSQTPYLVEFRARSNGKGSKV